MLQNSLELGEKQPQPWVRLSLPAVPASLAGAGRVRRGDCTRAWCRLPLSWRGSKSNILQGRYSHAVRTLNLKGPCVPASERAGFCF